eukprot:s4708_g3.t1
MKGPRCEFCHLEHNHPKRKLRKQERQRLEEMPELLVLLILQWHVQSHAAKLRLDEPLRLVLAVLERRVKLLREARPPTHAELRWAMENLWTLRGFSLGRSFDAFQLWPQVDKAFQREVKFLVDSMRQNMALRSGTQ